MTLDLDIFNARLLGYEGLQMILVDRIGRIKEILPMDTVNKRIAPTDLKGLNVAGDWISLGGVDLQINGALGLPFPDLTPKNADKLAEICQFLWERGVDGFLPTLVTTSVEKIQQSLAVLADFAAMQPEDSSAAKMLGVHLEGPFLNPQKRGAHPAEFLLPLTIDNVKHVLGDYAQIVKVITLAPELDSTGEVIPYLRSLGITVSLGHSMATAAQAQQAFELGARMVTHAFNAMPPLHHREPGLLGAALIHEEVRCGLIADGEHVSPIVLELLLRASRSPHAPLSKGGLTGNAPLSKGGLTGNAPSKGGLTGNAPLSKGGLTGNAPLSKGGLTGNAPSKGGLTGNAPSKGGLTGNAPSKGGLTGNAPSKGGLTGNAPSKGGLTGNAPSKGGLTGNAPLSKGGSTGNAPLGKGGWGDRGVFLVSDALAPLGLPDGIYPWDRREIEVKNGTARLPDGTLAGTTLPLLVGVQNLVKWGICQVEEAIALATVAPRWAIGLMGEGTNSSHQIPTKKDKTNCHYLGQPADRLLRWHWEKSTSELTWQRLQKFSHNK